MGRPGILVASVATALTLGGGVRTAAAEPTRKITIESDPPGAHVYLNAKEDGVRCEATPCTIDVPLGETPLIVELENYAPSITMLEVTKGRGPLKQSIKLVAAGGGINAKAPPGVKNATVKVDEEDKGVAPLRIPVDAGSHHVAYYVDGKQIYEEYIEVEAGPDYFELVPKPGGATGGPTPTDDGNPLDPTDGDVKASAPAPARGRMIVTASALFDIGFRQFSYDNGTGKNTRPESEGGQLLVGPLVEFYPTALLAPGTLPGLALLARFELGFHDNTVTGSGITGATTTFWQSLEVSARNRWVIGGAATVDASAGYVRDRYQFNGLDSDIALVPDADYQSLRLGTRGALSLGDLEPYLVLENRLVLSSGNLGARYDKASTNGLHAALGVTYRHGAVTARFEGQLTRYGSTYTNLMPNALTQADGASDVIEMISMAVGYAY